MVTAPAGGLPAARTTRREVRNPLLTLPAVAQLRQMPTETQDALRAVLRQLSEQAARKAEHSWRTKKAPMAAYWKAVSVYAKHTARVLGAARATARAVSLSGTARR